MRQIVEVAKKAQYGAVEHRAASGEKLVSGILDLNPFRMLLGDRVPCRTEFLGYRSQFTKMRAKLPLVSISE